MAAHNNELASAGARRRDSNGGRAQASREYEILATVRRLSPLGKFRIVRVSQR